MNSRSSSLRAAALAALTLAALAAEPAMARTTTITGSNGAAVATRTVTRDGGNVSSNTTMANGQVLGTRTVERTSESTTATVTGPAGNTATRQTTGDSSGIVTNISVNGQHVTTITTKP